MERAKDPRFRFLSLAHLVDEAALLRAFQRICKDAAAGVDGITKEPYGQAIEENLRDLYERLVAVTVENIQAERPHASTGAAS